jgi:PncC family amidohydrolase
VISYSNEVKADVLGVSRDSLASVGAVSSEVAAQMATGARRVIGSDLAVSLTGIAGPGGGSAEKPVGLVWFGLATSKGVTTQSRIFPGDRAAIRSAAIAHALGLLLSAVE